MDLERLKSLPFLEGVDDDDLAVLATFASEREVEAGQPVMRAGEYAYDLMLVESGHAAVVRDGTSVAKVGPGDVIGEMALLADQLRMASVVAATPMRVIVISSWDVKRLMEIPVVKQRLDALAARRDEP